MGLKVFAFAMAMFFVGVIFVEWSIYFTDWQVFTTRMGRLFLFIYTIFAIHSAVKYQHNEESRRSEEMIETMLQKLKEIKDNIQSDTYEK